MLPHLLANYLQLPPFFTWRCISEINTLKNVSCCCNYRLLPGQKGIPGSPAPFLPQGQRLPASFSTQVPQCSLAWRGWDGTWLWEHRQRLPHNPPTRWPCLRNPSSFQQKTSPVADLSANLGLGAAGKKAFSSSLPCFAPFPLLHLIFCFVSYFFPLAVKIGNNLFFSYKIA